jgi:2-polyprenyl-3-methyl-5-hydroxy-6-metoxy-1,4-benzoquinol methylase
MTYIGDQLKITLDELAHVQKYNLLIYECIKPYLGKSILEIGAGIGNVSKHLINSKPDLLILSDFEEDFVKILSDNFKNIPNIKVVKFDISKDSYLDNNSIDTIICINVLEHIKEDLQALINCNKILSYGGKLILFLPANQFLYGALDISLGHYRRYNKDEITKKLQAAGFKVNSVRYFNAIGILGWLINSRVLKKNTIPLFQLKFFELISFFVQLEKYIKIPFGLSLIVVAHKDK